MTAIQLAIRTSHLNPSGLTLTQGQKNDVLAKFLLTSNPNVRVDSNL